MESFQLFSPSPLLAPYIKNYCFLEASCSGSSPQRIIPTGCCALHFHRGDRLQQAATLSWQPRAAFCIPSVHYYDLIQTGPVDLVSVVFHPHTAAFFLPVPLSELKSSTCSAADLSLRGFAELEERLWEARDRETAVCLIESFLLKWLQINREYNYKRLSIALHHINRGVSDLDQLAESACLGYKQFKRIFTVYTGVHPKDFLRIIRFQRALYHLQLDPHKKQLSALACGCGFYDQSHMIREFREFSGYTPGEFLTLFNPYSDYFS